MFKEPRSENVLMFLVVGLVGLLGSLSVALLVAGLLGS